MRFLYKSCVFITSAVYAFYLFCCAASRVVERQLGCGNVSWRKSLKTVQKKLPRRILKYGEVIFLEIHKRCVFVVRSVKIDSEMSKT